jgi:hypothetical protein
MGILHGQYDGWSCWDRARVWGQSRPDMVFGTPEESWDLLKTFFPRAVLSPIYRYPCPHEPVGYFSGTPFGPVDIVPVEAAGAKLSAYSALSFLGWNTSDAGQVERLLEYAEQGGRLLWALPHVSTEIRRGQAPAPVETPQLRDLLGLEIRGLVDAEGGFRAERPSDRALFPTIDKKKLQLGAVVLRGANALVTDTRGTPVVAERTLGRGRVTWVNAAAYPGDPALAGVYAELLRRMGTEIREEQRRDVWVQGSDDVSFAVWDHAELRTVYLLNVNWWSDAPSAAAARLLWGDVEVPLELARDRIHAITVQGDWGVWTSDRDTDVMAMEGDTREVVVDLQGQGRTELTVLHRGRGSPQLLASARGESVTIEPLAIPGLWRLVLNLDGPQRLRLRLPG